MEDDLDIGGEEDTGPLSGFFSRLLGATPSPAATAAAANSSAQRTPRDQREEEVLRAASQWEGQAAALFTFAMIAAVGNDLKPDEKMALNIVAPLTRIAMRHIDPMRTASNDAIDAVMAAAAFALYAQAIYPYWLAQRAEKKVASTHATPVSSQPGQAAPAHPGRGGIIPIARRRAEPTSPARPSQPGQPAPAPAQPVASATDTRSISGASDPGGPAEHAASAASYGPENERARDAAEGDTNAATAYDPESIVYEALGIRL